MELQTLLAETKGGAAGSIPLMMELLLIKSGDLICWAPPCTASLLPQGLGMLETFLCPRLYNTSVFINSTEYFYFTSRTDHRLPLG